MLCTLELSKDKRLGAIGLADLKNRDLLPLCN